MLFHLFSFCATHFQSTSVFDTQNLANRDIFKGVLSIRQRILSLPFLRIHLLLYTEYKAKMFGVFEC